MKAIVCGVVAACAAGACGDDEPSLGRRPPLPVFATRGGSPPASVIDSPIFFVELPSTTPVLAHTSFRVGLDRAVPGGGSAVDTEAGVAAIRCPGAPGFGVDGTYVTAAEDTYVHPRIAELPPQADTVLVIQAPVALPTSSRCTLALLGVLTDDAGRPFELPPVTFLTEPITAGIPNFQPEGGDLTLRLDFNVEVRPETVTAERFELRSVQGGVGPDVAAVSLDRRGFVLQLAAPLDADQRYVLRIAPGIEDSYGQTRPDTFDVGFTTP